MKTFFNILQTVVNIKEKKYPSDPFILSYKNNELYTEVKLHIRYLINQIYFNEQKHTDSVSQYNKNAFAKLISLNVIINNSFYEKQLKEDIINAFSNAQKHYYAFSKLARFYKLKKYPFVVTDDLSMNELDPNNKNTFLLIDNKSKYLFSINDLISIIETAIGNAPDFFAEPLSPLNPYNKQAFTISTLYNIYFKMKESGRLISVLFHFFFLQNFCKYKFSQHYEHHIRENAIKRHVFNSPYTILYNCVFDMLEDNVYTQKYNIHKHFPKEILVNIFRPFLFYYYIIHYDFKGTNKVYNYKQILHNKLRKFYQYNKAFGRRYIQVTRCFGKVVKKEYKFNTDHINFYEISSTAFNVIVTPPTTETTTATTFNNTNLVNAFNTSIHFIYDSDATISDATISDATINEETNMQNTEDEETVVHQELEQMSSEEEDNDSIS